MATATAPLLILESGSWFRDKSSRTDDERHAKSSEKEKLRKINQNTIEILKEPIVIGRNKECDIVLDDINASRIHGVIYVKKNWWKENWYIKDNKSTYGTIIIRNGRNISVREKEERLQSKD